MATCAIYIRVSTEDQAQHGYSLVDQEERCRERADERGYAESEIQVFADEGYSGDDFGRPGLSLMRQAIREGAVNRVVIFDPDRFSRNLSQQLLVTDEIVRAGAQLEFINFEWRDTPEGRLFYALRGAISEYEKFKIKERAIRGRLQKAKRGLLSGDPRLFGYRYDAERDFIFPDLEQAPIVHWMFELAADGLSREAIARKLAEAGVMAPRGSKWYAVTVGRILRNRAYTGDYELYKSDVHSGRPRIRSREERFPVEIEPIVERDLFEAAQGRLASFRRLVGRPATGSGYLLRGIVRCGLCGRAVNGGATTRTRKVAYYSCSGKRHRPSDATTGLRIGRCSLPYFNRDVLDRTVWSTVEELLMAAPAHAFADESLSNSSALQAEAVVVAKTETELTQARERLRSLYIRGRVCEQDYWREDQEMLATLDRLAARRGVLATLEQERRSVDKEPHPLPKRSLASLDFADKSAILHAVLERVELFPDRTVRMRLRQV